MRISKSEYEETALDLIYVLEYLSVPYRHGQLPWSTGDFKAVYYGTIEDSSSRVVFIGDWWITEFHEQAPLLQSISNIYDNNTYDRY